MSRELGGPILGNVEMVDNLLTDRLIPLGFFRVNKCYLNLEMWSNVHTTYFKNSYTVESRFKKARFKKESRFKNFLDFFFLDIFLFKG